MSFTDAEVEVALAKFVSDSEDVALEGFTVLIAFGRPVLDASLRKNGVHYDKAQDIIQNVFIKLWRYQSRFKNEGKLAFQGLLHTMARNETNDSRGHDESPLDDIIVKVIPSWDDVMERKRILELVLLVAGEVWLGFKPGVTQAERDQRVLAAQLHLEGFSWQEAMAVAQGPQDKGVFEAWVCDPATVLALFFEELNLSGDDLMRHFLKLPEDEDLTAIYQEAVRAPTETAAMFWKYRDAEKPATIKAFARVLFGPKLNDAQLESLFTRCDAELPFLQILETKMNAFSNEIRPLLKGKGLWKRLVFELWFFQEVPQKDIVARLAPAAAAVGVKIDMSTLTSWIGNGRLLDDFRGGMA